MSLILSVAIGLSMLLAILCYALGYAAGVRDTKKIVLNAVTKEILNRLKK